MPETSDRMALLIQGMTARERDAPAVDQYQSAGSGQAAQGDRGGAVTPIADQRAGGIPYHGGHIAQELPQGLGAAEFDIRGRNHVQGRGALQVAAFNAGAVDEQFLDAGHVQGVHDQQVGARGAGFCRATAAVIDGDDAIVDQPPGQVRIRQ